MTEDEATTVAKLAARCAWGGRGHLGLIMRYGRLFSPGMDAGGGAHPMVPAYAGKNAYLDLGTDIALDLGRDIPPRVRDWALTGQPPTGGDRVAPAWVLEELLRFPV
jgi:hypothetical protein